MIDLKNLKPTVISRNLKGKYLLIYGLPKVGKTTLLSQLPKSLILAYEPGVNALNNVNVVMMNSWLDQKTVLSQLKDPAVQEKFDFIGIDTADIAWDRCVEFICQQNDVQNLGDIPYGKGYDLAKREFAGMWREIALLGYGLCFVSHSTEKTFKNEKGGEYISLAPALPTRPYDIINKLVDIIGYIRTVWDEKDQKRITKLFLRGDERFIAGSRFKYIEPVIDFSYENLANAIYDAIDKQAEVDGVKPTNEGNNFFKPQEEEEIDYDALMEESKKLWTSLLEKDEKNADKIMYIIEKTFGRKMKLSEVKVSQKELLKIVVEQMRQL